MPPALSPVTAALMQWDEACVNLFSAGAHSKVERFALPYMYACVNLFRFLQTMNQQRIE